MRITGNCPVCRQALAIELPAEGDGVIPPHGHKRACVAIGRAVERPPPAPPPALPGPEPAAPAGPPARRYLGMGERAALAAVAASVLACWPMPGGTYHPRTRPEGHRRFPVPR